MRIIERVVMGIWHTDKDVNTACAKLREFGLQAFICPRLELHADSEVDSAYLVHCIQADVREQYKDYEEKCKEQYREHSKEECEERCKEEYRQECKGEYREEHTKEHKEEYKEQHWEQSTIPTLWIVDDRELADRLRQDNQGVLICLHAGNSTQDFYDFSYAVEGLEDLDADFLDKVYRRHVGSPWEILSTKRCCLRETTIDDLEAFYQIYAEPSMTEYMEDLYPDKEQEKVYLQEYIKQQYGFYGFGVWTVRLRETDEIIGRAGLFYREGHELPELGFLIGVPWQGMGLATEVCEAVLAYGLEEMSFSTVQALVVPGNVASEAVCRKLRMEPEAIVFEQGIEYRRWIWNKE